MNNPASPQKPQLFSASEVGQFVVCPESWRLKRIKKVSYQQSDRSSEGKVAHDQWSKDVDKAAHMRLGLRFLISLIVSMIVTALYMAVDK